jgi:hypothetical protein
LSPRSVVIEILESAVKEVGELLQFVGNYRDAGFLIALDDVGSGHSNLNRIPMVQPDIIKVDRYLIQDVDRDFYKQEVLKSLVSMAMHLGTVIIAEGVETEGEVATLLELGVDIIQGYFFSHPKTVTDLDLGGVDQLIKLAGTGFRERQLANADRKHGTMTLYRKLIRELQKDLAGREPIEFGSRLPGAVEGRSSVECIYVLDDTGRQITDMVVNAERRPDRKSAMFRPLPVGADHSLRDYFYFLSDSGFGKSSYVTKPHVSMNTGNLCVTIAAKIKDIHNRAHILCLDVQTL